ncbi:MAG: MerR family transcriptional regulator [Acidobacteriaceae bacterium]
MKNAANRTGALETRSYSSGEVVRLTGTTPRQLQWWDEQGIVVPAREGRKRRYRFAELAELQVIAELRDKGLPLRGVKKMMRFLRHELGCRLAEVITDGSEYHLLTDGTTIFVLDSATGVVDVVKHARQAVFGVCLSDSVLRLRGECEGGAGRKRRGEKKHPKPVARAGRDRAA